jgi:hypothetical protein
MITSTGSSRQMKLVLRSTRPRSRQGVFWQCSKIFPLRCQTVGQRAGRGRSHIWGNHGQVVSVSGAGLATRTRAEWQEYQSLTRKGQHEFSRELLGGLRAISSVVRGSPMSKVVLRGYRSRSCRTLSKSASGSSAYTVLSSSDVGPGVL